MNKFTLLPKILPYCCIFITFFALYFAYRCWKDEQIAITKTLTLEAQFKAYQQNNNAIKQIESTIIETIKDEQAKTENLRDNVDNGLVELRVKVAAIERNNATTGDIAEQALRLAKSSQQDYYRLTNAIDYNRAIIEGWQQYYCLEIAPKNNTQFMCKE